MKRLILVSILVCSIKCLGASGGLSGSPLSGGGSGSGTGAATNVAYQVMTNFVLNTVYTNTSGGPMLISSLVRVHTAAVNGDASIDLMVDQAGGVIFIPFAGVRMGTIVAVTLSMDYTNSVFTTISNLASYYWTNSSIGAGNVGALIAGTASYTALGAVTNFISSSASSNANNAIPPVGVSVVFPNGASIVYSDLASAFTAATAGSVIQLGPQTFAPTTSLMVPTNAIVEGNGSKIIWTNMSAGLGANAACFILSDNCVVRDIYFVNTNLDDASGYLNFVSRTTGTATNWLISGCRFEGVIDSLIFLTNRMQGVIRGCRFGGAYDQITIYAPNGSADPRTTNTFDIAVYDSKFAFDDRNAGTPEPLSINSASGRIRFYDCEFVNNKPAAISLSLYTFDTVSNVMVEFYNCSSSEVMTTHLTAGAEKPSLFNCNFLVDTSANINYNGTNSFNISRGLSVAGGTGSSLGGSNFVTLLVVTNFATVSNLLTIAAQPDFRQVSPLFVTNASFVWATPTGFDTAGNDVNYTTITVSNNSASPIVMTGPANYNLIGTNSVNAGGVNEVRMKRTGNCISNWYSLQDR